MSVKHCKLPLVLPPNIKWSGLLSTCDVKWLVFPHMVSRGWCPHMVSGGWCRPTWCQVVGVPHMVSIGWCLPRHGVRWLVSLPHVMPIGWCPPSKKMVSGGCCPSPKVSSGWCLPRHGVRLLVSTPTWCQVVGVPPSM